MASRSLGVPLGGVITGRNCSSSLAPLEPPLPPPASSLALLPSSAPSSPLSPEASPSAAASSRRRCASRRARASLPSVDSIVGIRSRLSCLDHCRRRLTAAILLVANNCSVGFLDRATAKEPMNQPRRGGGECAGVVISSSSSSSSPSSPSSIADGAPAGINGAGATAAVGGSAGAAILALARWSCGSATGGLN